MFISYAQNCEDIVLWRALRHIEQGTYVDVGAADPAEYSVTKAFYDRGWSGINVEPAPEFVEKLNADRPRDTTFALCAGDVEGPITLHYVPGTGLSTLTDDHLEVIAEKQFDVVDIQTEVKRLDTLLADAGFAGREIHFLKVDVEGAEESVLRSIDLATWRPWVIVVEATQALTTAQNHGTWDPILTKAGYTFCLFDGLNRFYAADEHSELVPAMSYPAGVFDQPYTVGTGQNELAARAEAVIAERDELAASYAKLQAEHELGIQGYVKLTAELDASLTGYERLQAELQSSLDGYSSLQVELASALTSYDELHSKFDESIRAFHTVESAYQESVDGYARLTAEYQRTIDSYHALETELRSTLEGYARLHGQYDDVLAVNEQARSAHAALVAEHQVAHEQAADLESQLNAARSELASIKGSKVWKLSEPVRHIAQKRSR